VGSGVDALQMGLTMELFDIAAALDDTLDDYMEERARHIVIAVACAEPEMMGVGQKSKKIGDKVVTVSILRSKPRMDRMHSVAADSLPEGSELSLLYRERSV